MPVLSRDAESNYSLAYVSQYCIFEDNLPNDIIVYNVTNMAVIKHFYCVFQLAVNISKY